MYKSCYTMTNQEAVTESINSSDFREQLREALDKVRVHNRRLRIEKSGIPVAALVSTDDLARLERLDRGEPDTLRTRRAIAGILVAAGGWRESVDLAAFEGERAAWREAPDREPFSL